MGLPRRLFPGLRPGEARWLFGAYGYCDQMLREAGLVAHWRPKLQARVLVGVLNGIVRSPMRVAL